MFKMQFLDLITAEKPSQFSVESCVNRGQVQRSLESEAAQENKDSRTLQTKEPKLQKRSNRRHQKAPKRKPEVFKF